jgi:hypothetical protein
MPQTPVSASVPEPIKRYDNPRPFFPGEHWVDLGVGLAAWLVTRKNRSLAVRTLGTFVAAALVARGAHGRHRLSQILRWTPVGGGIRRR